MHERRQVSRQKSFLSGRVYFNKRAGAADCLIRDISKMGARLVFSDAAQTPDAIEISIPHRDQLLRAEVRWRKGQEAGVAFVNESLPAADANGRLEERVAQLENEIALLRRMLQRLKGKVDGEPEAA